MAARSRARRGVAARLGAALRRRGAPAGTTTLVDHHESPNFIEGSLDILADAAQALGLRLVDLLRRDRAQRRHAEGAARSRRVPSLRRANRRPLVRGIVGLHASFTVSDDTIREAGEPGARARAPRSRPRRRGLRPMSTTPDAAATPDRSSACSRSARCRPARSSRTACTWATTAGAPRRRRGLWLVQNPRSNEGNRVGFPRALAASPNVALGTDGYPADMRPRKPGEQARIATIRSATRTRERGTLGRC